MVRLLFPIIFSSLFILLFGLIEVLLLRTLNKDWWSRRWVRRVAWGLPLGGLVSLGLWGVGEYFAYDLLSYPFRLISGAVFISEVALMLALPISGLLKTLNRVWDRIVLHRRNERGIIDERRRLFLKGAAAVVPVATLAMAGAGTVRAFQQARIVRKEFAFANLPDELIGLRILQLSDLHLHHYVTVRDLDMLLEELAAEKPDLVLVTGDTADDLKQLPEALTLIPQLAPKYGTYAVLGNHEYFRGVEQVVRTFSKSTVPLLIDHGVNIPVGGTNLFVGGIDDPRSMGAKHDDFFKDAIDTCMSQDKGSNFKVLMSHRPDAFRYASERMIDLTLSGHTHGGQIGFLGRSIFEGDKSDRFLWGEYTLGTSRMYTTCGAGHWFPFRLGCPPEAPILTLQKA